VKGESSGRKIFRVAQKPRKQKKDGRKKKGGGKKGMKRGVSSRKKNDQICGTIFFYFLFSPSILVHSYEWYPTYLRTSLLCAYTLSLNRQHSDVLYILSYNKNKNNKNKKKTTKQKQNKKTKKTEHTKKRRTKKIFQWIRVIIPAALRLANLQHHTSTLVYPVPLHRQVVRLHR